MRDVHGKDDRLEFRSVLEPMPDDAADQRIGVDAAGQLADDIVAGLRGDAAEVDFWRCIGPGADQEAELDQGGSRHAIRRPNIRCSLKSV